MVVYIVVGKKNHFKPSDNLFFFIIFLASINKVLIIRQDKKKKKKGFSEMNQNLKNRFLAV